MKAIVAEGGKVTIPKSLQEQLNIHTGTVLEFTKEEGRLVAVKIQAHDPMDHNSEDIGRDGQSDLLIDELLGDR